jgi:hypothetical protein
LENRGTIVTQAFAYIVVRTSYHDDYEGGCAPHRTPIATYLDETLARRHAEIAAGQLAHIKKSSLPKSQWDVAQFLTFDPMLHLTDFGASYHVASVPFLDALPGTNGLHSWYTSKALPALPGADGPALEGALAHAFRALFEASKSSV